MNYYEILGVDKDCSQADIKKAYRELAMKYHPDRNPGDEESEAKFKEVNEAHSVLSDPNKRSSFDRFGVRDQNSRQYSGSYPDIEDIINNFTGNFNRNPRSPRPGGNVTVRVPVTLSEAVLGTKTRIRISLADPCGDCGSRGYTEYDSCELCNGNGMSIRQEGNMRMMVPCQACRGVGEFQKNSCPTCKGSKVVDGHRDVVATIPPGIKHRDTMRLNGQGQRGFFGGQSGDMMVSISVSYPDNLSEEQKEFFKSLDLKPEPEAELKPEPESQDDPEE